MLRDRGFSISQNTEKEFDTEVTIDVVRANVKRIATAIDGTTEAFSTYVVGMGAQHRGVFDEIDRLPGARVVFREPLLSGFLRILSPIIACFRGLIRIESASALVPVFELLVNRSMVGLYHFSSDRGREFELAVRAHTTKRSYDFGVKSDAAYFIYVVDADNSESQTGIFEIVSYGTNAPSLLKL